MFNVVVKFIPSLPEPETKFDGGNEKSKLKIFQSSKCICIQLNHYRYGFRKSRYGKLA